MKGQTAPIHNLAAYMNSQTDVAYLFVIEV